MHPFNPNGLFGLGANAMTLVHGDEIMPALAKATMPAGLPDTMLARAPADIPSWHRRAAWVNTAGSFDMTWCADARGRLIHRDAAKGSHYAWDAHRVIPLEQGGADAASNLQALNSSRNS